MSPEAFPLLDAVLKHESPYIRLSPRNSVNSLSIINYSLYVKADRGKMRGLLAVCQRLSMISVIWWTEAQTGAHFIFGVCTRGTQCRRCILFERVLSLYQFVTAVVVAAVITVVAVLASYYLRGRLKMTDEKDINYYLQ